MVDVDEVKKRLLEKQVELQQRVGATQATERHETEEGLNNGAQLWEVSETRDGLDDEAMTELDQVNDALARLAAGEYGNCKVCGNPIGEARLEALPYTTLCIDDAEDAEDHADQEAFDPNEY